MEEVVNCNKMSFVSVVLMAPKYGPETSLRTSNLSSVLRIRDVSPGFEFLHPGSASMYFNLKNYL
jgi:hypothetical protein